VKSRTLSPLFADDLVIWILLPKHQEHWLSEIMSEALTTLSNWCNEKAMTINTEKKILSDLHPEPQTNKNPLKY
jgi:hypothetical protein